MDLWDVTKLMWRRWYVTAPMLLVTILAAIWVMTSVGPEYQATGHVAVVPPQELRQAEAGEVARINPWNQEALAHAARIRLEAARLEEEMAAEGYTGRWSVDVTGFIPVLQIEVVAPTTDQAVATMHRLQEVVDAEVADRQAEYGLAEGELFTTVRYDQGESVETTASRLRRALVAVVGAGIILTAGVVLAFDAIVRWRRSRHDPAMAGEPAVAPPGAPAAEEHRPRYTYGGAGGSSGKQPVTTRPVGANGGAAPAEVPRQVSVRLAAESSRVSSAPPAPANGEPAAAPVNGGASSPDREHPGRDLPGREQPGRDLEDSTIVLPLSNAPWAGRTKRDWPPAGGEAPDSGGAGNR